MDRILEVALTGNRFSGKDVVANQFRKVGIPVFDADTILKFLLNHRTYVDGTIQSRIGPQIYTGGFIDINKVKSDLTFDKIIDVVEFELFETFDSFKKSCEGAIYVIFMSSILYERKYNTKFDYVINVFSPKETRIDRSREIMKKDYISTYNLFKNEVSELTKNQESNFVIHSYEGGPNVVNQVKNIDESIIDGYIKSSIVNG